MSSSRDASDAQRDLHARSFEAAADAYERGRPSYPDAAVDWLLEGAGRRVLDLGAGTGKLTRLLHARGLDVTAVEPLPAMRRQLAAAVPGVPALYGSAEAIPLPDASVDAVLVAQAWHWVDPVRAVPEVARVLAPGGVLGLLWNGRDDRRGWTAELGRLLAAEGAPPSGSGADTLREWPELFGPVEEFTVPWQYELGVAELLDLVASRSYVIVLPDAERAALLGEVRTLAAEHPDLAGRNRFVMPYRTRCFRTRRRGET